jgi:hypothetical protein
MSKENANDKLEKWLKIFNELPELQCAYCGVVFKGGHECDYKLLKEKVEKLQQDLGYYKQYYEDNLGNVSELEEELEQQQKEIDFYKTNSQYFADVAHKQLIEYRRKIECYEKVLKECIEQDGLMKFLDDNDWAISEDYFVQLAKDALYK